MKSQEIYNNIMEPVGGPFGAPSGRRSNAPRNWDNVPHFDRYVRFVAGGYDHKGAYWGYPCNLRLKFSKDGQFWEFYRTY